jgi:hypothetical protein
MEGSMSRTFNLVRADWDPEAEVFVTTADDVPAWSLKRPHLLNCKKTEYLDSRAARAELPQQRGSCG